MRLQHFNLGTDTRLFLFLFFFADFDFDSGLHNVMEVSRREYESCSADNPFKVFWDGPARVALMEEGVFYFVCSIANYCALGQKLSVAVHSEKNSPHSAPTSSQRPPKSSQPSPDASKMPPPAMTPYSSQAPTSMTDLSVSLVTVKSAGDQCCNDAVCLGWLSLFGLLFHFI